MTTEKTNVILHMVSKRVQELIPSERFYVALFDRIKNQLSFPVLRASVTKEFSPLQTRTLKENILPDLVVMQAESILIKNSFSLWLEEKKNIYWPDNNLPQSWLGVPMIVGDQAIGALVVESWQTTTYFSENDQRILETIARQTATAIENSRLYEQLDHKVANLKILNHVGQQLMKGFAKQESEILELIYKSATNLDLDTRNMYITFYDPSSELPDTADEIYGRLRFALAYDEDKRITFPDRPARNGLTEYVIRTKGSFNPLDVKKAYQEVAQDQIGKIPLSWLGVPMLAEGQVFGVIVLRNNEFEQSYSQDDQEVLEILAGQAAISLLNLRYYEALKKETEQRISVEKAAVMSTMAAEFAHKMNNIAGTIPVRVNLARAELDPGNPKSIRILKQLDKIEAEVKNLLSSAQEIRESIELGKARVVETVNINELLDIAAVRAKNTQMNAQNEVEVKKRYGKDLPKVKLDRKALLDTLTSIIKNGFEAIAVEGTVLISTRLSQLEENSAIEVEIKDTGKGIPPAELPKIFDLFYTTKGDNGLGFGLWRDKLFLKNLGGEIDVFSEVGRGSIFTLRIPIKQNN